MRDREVQDLKNNILFDLDTIRIEQTSFSEPDKSYTILKLLKEISDIVEERFDEKR